jgi:hypothetical protein
MPILDMSQISRAYRPPEQPRTLGALLRTDPGPGLNALTPTPEPAPPPARPIYQDELDAQSYCEPRRTLRLRSGIGKSHGAWPQQKPNSIL